MTGQENWFKKVCRVCIETPFEFFLGFNEGTHRASNDHGVVNTIDIDGKLVSKKMMRWKKHLQPRASELWKDDSELWALLGKFQTSFTKKKCNGFREKRWHNLYSQNRNDRR